MPSLRGDRRLIKQTLLNLIDNAVKFTPGGGQVEIAAHLDDSGSVLITVSDTGIGIPADQIPRAMEPFGQIDGSLSRKYEGTGLGLPLAKRFVEMHGGSLVLESMIDCGTTVKISLPAERVLDSSATLLKRLAAQC